MNRILTNGIGVVWLINGLFCKVLDLVPRHQQIVARILGDNQAILFTKLIGIAEMVMAVWIWSRYKARLNAITQMIVVLVMNVLEFILVPDLLLFGKINSVFALSFVFVIYYNEFVVSKEFN
ncbi:MAG: hypothetical protein DI538_10375 [Azospira oryzae]|nr:MAG: hypothetical protein DI538_10375 [Azospira oryzae]